MHTMPTFRSRPDATAITGRVADGTRLTPPGALFSAAPRRIATGTALTGVPDAIETRDATSAEATKTAVAKTTPGTQAPSSSRSLAPNDDDDAGGGGGGLVVVVIERRHAGRVVEVR